MLVPHNPLAAALKSARGAMLNKDLAAAAGWTASKVSKIETGRQPPTLEDLQQWARITGVGDTTLQQWYSLLAQLKADRRNLGDVLRGGQRGLQDEYNRMIDRCRDFRMYENTFIPRFLQTPAYTRGMLEYTHLRHRPEIDIASEEAQRDIADAVALRQASTRHLHDTDRSFQLLLEESVLHTWRFSHDTWRGQLLRLQQVIDLPNLRLGILPQHRLAKIFTANSFEIYDDLVDIELAFSREPKIRTDEVQAYRDHLDQLWGEAVDGDAAHTLIEQARRALPH